MVENDNDLTFINMLNQNESNIDCSLKTQPEKVNYII